jgi:hypothetical protein
MNEAAIAALIMIGGTALGYILMALCYLRNLNNR